MDPRIFRGWRRSRRFYWQFPGAVLMLLFAFLTLSTVHEWTDPYGPLGLAIPIILLILFLVGFGVFLPPLHHMGALVMEMRIERGTDQALLARVLREALSREIPCEIVNVGPYGTQEQEGMYNTNPRATVHITISESGSKRVVAEVWYYIEEGRIDVLVPRAHVDIIPLIEGAVMNLR